jgi:hypothetical protein
MERRLGSDFSNVRIHTDAQAVESAAAVSAQAYTKGNEVVFGHGSFAPHTPEGQYTLAHELAHVVQQRGTGDLTRATLKLSQEKDPAEREADAVATAVTAGDHLSTGAYRPTRHPRLVSSSGPVVARQPSKTPVNDSRRLAEAMSLEQLFELYTTNEAQYVIGPLPPYHNPTYTKTWIRGAGQQAIQREISRRLAGLGQAELINLNNFIDATLRPPAFDAARQQWLLAEVGTGLPLTHDQRAELRRLVGDRMNDAYGDFTHAAERVAAALKAAVNAEAALLSLVVDVFMGLLSPGLARGIATVVDKIPETAISSTLRGALKRLDKENAGLILAAATKVGKEAIKMNASALFGETDVNVFMEDLRKVFRTGTDAVNQKLPNLTDEALGILAATYDPDSSDTAHYVPIIQDLIDRFRRQVQPIGPATSVNVTDPVDRTVTEQTGLVWVRKGTDIGLTQVKLTRSSLDPGSYMYFQTFIDKQLKDFAVNKAMPNQPHGIQTIDASLVIGFPASIPSDTARP